ncbi:MAG: hypothetical protein HKO05_11500 [Erythrobacter sp.]|nr:hypothetical protein [Erythrobacter sp.]
MSDPAPRPLDPLVRFAVRQERAIEIVGGIWFALSCAVYARFIDLPDIPFSTDELALYASAAANGVWWGFVRPAFQKRQAELLQGRAGD